MKVQSLPREIEVNPGPGGISSLRKAALLIVSLEESLAQQLVAHLDRADIDALNLELTRLEHVDPALQRAVLEEFVELGRHQAPGFGTIERANAATIRRAFREEELEIWALALAGAARGARTRVLNALAPRASSALRAALGALGPFRLDEVEQAQNEVMTRLRESDRPEGSAEVR